MDTLTKEQFKAMVCCSDEAVEQWYGPMIQSMEDWEINTPLRVAGYLAEIALECAKFTELAENMNYSIQGLMRTWPSRFRDQTTAAAYAHNPEKLAEFVYGSRGGNTEPGDGFKFRGHGPMMLTFRNNYYQCMKETGIPRLMDNPEVLMQPEPGSRMSGWFWNTHGCNQLMDAGDYRKTTLILNGALTGYEDGNTTGLNDRVELFVNNKQLLGIA